MSVEYYNTVDAPKSLDVKFFQEVLENVLLEANADLKKIVFTMGSAAGDNFCSKIYRVRLTYSQNNGTNDDISVIVKSIPISDSNKFLEDLEFFLKEKITYNHMLPRMEILLDNVKFAPKLYHSHKEPINTLVFEDLSPLGYVLQDRVKGLDFKHMQIAMKKIGQFHGVSMEMIRKEPQSMRTYKDGILSQKCADSSDFYDKHFGNLMKGLIELISEWKGFESITEKVKKYSANLKENLIKSMLPIPGELKVLNHGDYWVNNMLFRYNSEKEVDDVIFLDFQLSVYGSPGFDLNYVLYSSAQLDIIKERRMELLKIYYTALCETLTTLRHKDVPSFEEILTEVKRREAFSFYVTFCTLPVVTIDKSKSAENNFEHFMDERYAKKGRDMLYSSKRLQDTLRYTLKRFDEMGVLD